MRPYIGPRAARTTRGNAGEPLGAAPARPQVTARIALPGRPYRRLDTEEIAGNSYLITRSVPQGTPLAFDRRNDSEHAGLWSCEGACDEAPIFGRLGLRAEPCHRSAVII